eukprot:Phypoly_transcript_01934.p1 GENE.Phypoly_transcript_01934~~Phypoly_transcript_01934.p1  ORF type:complete len:907 (+),score=74.65 Phypoly_transcript_01934:197-2917(+)
MLYFKIGVGELMIRKQRYDLAVPIIQAITSSVELNEVARESLELWVDNVASVSVMLMNLGYFPQAAALLLLGDLWIKEYLTLSSGAKIPEEGYVVAKVLFCNGVLLANQCLYAGARKNYNQAIKAMQCYPLSTYRDKELIVNIYLHAASLLGTLGVFGPAEFLSLSALQCASELVACHNNAVRKSYFRVLESRAHSNLGVLYQYIDWDEGAHYHFKIGYGINQSVLPDDHITLVKSKLNVLESSDPDGLDLGELHKIEELLGSDSPESEEYSRILILLGTKYQHNKLLLEAEQYFTKAIQLPNRLAVRIIPLVQLARINALRNNFGAANGHYLEAIRIANHCDTVDSVRVNILYCKFLADHGRHSDGITHLMVVMDICLKIMYSVATVSKPSVQLLVIESVYDAFACCVQYMKALNGKTVDIELNLCSGNSSQMEQFNYAVLNFFISTAELSKEALRTAKHTTEKVESAGYRARLPSLKVDPSASPFFKPWSTNIDDVILHEPGVPQDSLLQIFNNLPEDTGFVQYFHDPYLDVIGNYLALVITPSKRSAHLLTLGQKTEIDSLICKVHPLGAEYIAVVARDDTFRGSRNIPDMDQFDVQFDGGDMVDHYQTLSENIWYPVEKHVGSFRKLIISRSGLLYLFPFELLQLSNGQNQQFLVDKYSFSYMTALDLIMTNKQKVGLGSTLGPPLIIADPNYDLGQVSPGCVARSKSIYGRLPGSKEEGERLGELLHVVPKMHNEATKSVLKDIQVPPTILHFATHAEFSNRTNAIILAGANVYARGGTVPPEVYDGILTTYDVSFLSLNGTKLVVLSTCISGIGVVSFNGLFGFLKEFLAAGVKCLIVSLCPVQDSTTSTFMTCMYTKLIQEKTTVNEAVRAARDMLRTAGEPKWSWASFIVVGNGEIKI